MTKQHPIRKNLRRLLSLVLAMATIAVCMWAVGASYGGFVSPNGSCIGALLSMTLPMATLGLFALLLIDIVFYRKLLWLPLLTILLCASAILSVCPLNFIRPSTDQLESDSTSVIKLMTFNVLNYDDYSKGQCDISHGNPTLYFILKQRPDIAVIQEGRIISDKSDFGVTSKQMQLFDSIFPYHIENYRGMSIYSRWPVSAQTKSHQKQWTYDLVHYKVALSQADTLNILNVHLQSLGLSPDDKMLFTKITDGHTKHRLGSFRHKVIAKVCAAIRERAQQAHYIVEVMDSIANPLIVCGDFNDTPGSYAMRTIMSDGLSDAYRQSGLGPAVTYHADRFYFRIDQILVSDDIRPLRTQVLKCNSSDHYPIVSYLKMPSVVRLDRHHISANVTQP